MGSLTVFDVDMNTDSSPNAKKNFGNLFSSIIITADTGSELTPVIGFMIMSP